MSDEVLKPDFYESGFIVTENKSELPEREVGSISIADENSEYTFLIIILPITVIIGAIIYFKKKKLR